MEIDDAVKEFQENLTPEKSNSSFDYCYNYFQSFYKATNIKGIAQKDNIQLSCLHLGFFLASWGMLRSSSFLFTKSLKYYEELIKAISNMDNDYWRINVHTYDKNSITSLLKIKKTIKEKLPNDLSSNSYSETLVTKIMLGIFGNVPALDKNFRLFCGTGTLNKKLLLCLREYYEDNKDKIDCWQKKIKTFDFYTGKCTNRCYPKAKIIDMIGFIKGQHGENMI